MIRQDIIDKISKYFKLSAFEAEQIYEDVFWQIIKGVKSDNLVELRDFGEFIIKYSDSKEAGSGTDIPEQEFKKTAEFLPSSRLEEEINRKQFETTQEIKEKFLSKEIPPQTPETLKTENEEQGPEKEPESWNKESAEPKPGQSIIEEEMRKKRAAIISRLSAPPAQQSAEEPAPKTEPQETEEFTGSGEEPTPPAEESLVVDEEGGVAASSFSDLLTEVPQTQEKPESEVEKPLVIPPAAVELHKEITGEAELPKTGQPVVEEETGVPAETDVYEDGSADKSYYIWYKDSEPSPEETKKMSYEYELLYQATKEVEYQSKLKIYVTTFILFFSIVLILLIFSPVIYKMLFIPESTQFTGISAEDDTKPASNRADKNVLPPVENVAGNIPDTSAEKTKVSEQQTQQQPPQQTQQQPPQQTQQETTDEKIEGITRIDTRWQDDKYRIFYSRLDNGKYVFQESSWNSEDKASNRVKIVESYNIPGLKGSVVRADLGEKGVWYRAVFGEFGSLLEARSKIAEIRKK